MSPEARGIERLWWLFFGTSAVIWGLVLFFTLLALLRRAREGRGPLPEPGPERSLARATGAATLLSVVVLGLLLAASVRTGRDLGRRAPAPEAVTIEITGQRWWWQIEYPASPVSQRVRTANELHVPTGKPIVLQLTSHDVIHSLWLPNLQGKRDLIPGRRSELRFTVDREGTYRGQCAEFCGLQHAHMGIVLVADSPQRFSAWLEQQRRPAPAPLDPQARRGQQVFLSAACPMCHGILGTPAAARRGPDLTHLMSRATLGAASLPSRHQPLLDWIRDAQRFKAGSLMPPNPLPAADLEALAHYLEGLR